MLDTCTIPYLNDLIFQYRGLCLRNISFLSVCPSHPCQRLVGKVFNEYRNSKGLRTNNNRTLDKHILCSHHFHQHRYSSSLLDLYMYLTCCTNLLTGASGFISETPSTAAKDRIYFKTQRLASRVRLHCGKNQRQDLLKCCRVTTHHTPNLVKAFSIPVATRSLGLILWPNTGVSLANWLIDRLTWEDLAVPGDMI